MIRIFLVSICGLCFHIGYSQQSPQGIGNVQDLRKVSIPPSPNASAIGKFGDIPVSLSTGIPSISIPLHKYSNQAAGLSLDVSLSYHAGGHKVEDMPSNVGLGWALNAGGVVSRTMRGRPDDGPGGYINTAALPYYYTTNYDKDFTRPSSSTPISEGVCYGNSTDYNQVKDVAENQLDGECDIFQFSVGDVSGKFFFKKNGTIQLVSQSNVRITCTRAPSGGLIQEFVITDGKGVQYVFNKPESTEAYSAIPGEPNSAIPIYVSSWYIDKIISADKQDEIVFNYTSPGTIMYEGGFSDSYRSTVSGGVIAGISTSQSLTYIYTAPQRVSSINLPDGVQIVFYYDLARLDYSGDKALTAVHVKNSTIEKRYVLSYSYFESPICYTGDPCTPGIAYSPNDYYKRLKLTSVQESDGTNNLPPYTFEYNATSLPNRHSKAQDWWGYYNGAGTNTTLTSTMPATGYPGGYITGGDKVSSEQHTKAWILDKIYFPTGGNTSFVYELNEGYKETTFRSIGGLRVKKTTDLDPLSGKTLVTNYTYKKSDNTSSGTLQTLPNYTYYWTAMSKLDQNGNPSMYEYYLNETSNPTQSLSYFSGSPVIYSRVKVDKDNNGLSNGFSVHEFTAFTSTMVHDNNFPYIQKQDLDWSQGLPLKESYFNSNGDLLRIVENEYQHYTFIPASTDVSSRNLIAGLLHWDSQLTFSQNLYGARAYYMAYGRSELTKSTEKLYGQGTSFIENITEYTYESQYFLTTKTKTKNSKGNNIETRFYYPFNYTTNGFPNRTAMLDANRVSEVISQEVWQEKNNVFYLKNAVVNDYGLFNSTMLKQNKTIALESTSPMSTGIVGNFNPNTLKRHSSFKDQVEFTNYDSKGRLTQTKYLGDVFVSFIWESPAENPVATVSNATADKIAYTSFESATYGNWNLASGTLLSTGGITGKKSFNGTLDKTLPAGDYTVSFWAQGSATVNGNTAPSLKSVGSWNLYEWQLSNVTYISVSGNNIDEVRLYPKLAQMTSFTYEPLVGMTSQCDVNNKIITYEYDGFGRLKIIRDQDGKIIKALEYKYQQNQ